MNQFLKISSWNGVSGSFYALCDCLLFYLVTRYTCTCIFYIPDDGMQIVLMTTVYKDGYLNSPNNTFNPGNVPGLTRVMCRV